MTYLAIVGMIVAHIVAMAWRGWRIAVVLGIVDIAVMPRSRARDRARRSWR